MLIQLNTDPGVQSFTQLYEHTLDMLVTVTNRTGHTTIVLGPMSPTDIATMDQNMFVLLQQAEYLSRKEWVVLELVSFQHVVERLIQDLNICGYPFPVLEEFTLPLIRSGWFDVVHMHKNYEVSTGAKREHTEAQEHGVPVVYFS